MVHEAALCFSARTIGHGMSDAFPTFTLPDVLRRLGAPSPSVASPSTLAVVEEIRHKETRLRKWVPARLLRRFDRGFARSYTIQPSTAQALYGIASALHAGVVIETGTYWGYSTALLAAACRDANLGVVHSFDLYKHAGRHIPRDLMTWIRLYRGEPATTAMPTALAGKTSRLFFQDSVHDYAGVLAELVAARPFLSADAVVLFHDFVVDGVRQAAVDGLPGYQIGRVDVDDPQQLGIAFGPALR